MSTETSTPKAPAVPRKKRAPTAAQLPPEAPATTPGIPEEWALGLLWHYRHQAGNTLVCVISDKELAEMRASFEYTKQDACVAGVHKYGRLILAAVERNTRILDPKTGALVSTGNEVRPCESSVDGGEQAKRAAERAALGQEAHETALRLLADERAGTFSGESIREAARLLTALSEAVR